MLRQMILAALAIYAVDATAATCPDRHPVSTQSSISTSPAPLPAPAAVAAESAGLIAEAKVAMQGDPEKALQLASTAEGLARCAPQSGDGAVAVPTAKWLQGEALVRLNQIDAAAPIIDDALRIVSRLPAATRLYADLLSTKAGVESGRGSAQDALRDYQKAYRIYVQLHDLRKQAVSLQNIGSIYQDADDYNKVLYYYKLAEEIYPDDPNLIISSSNNKANALSELRRYREAEKEYGRALEIAVATKSPLLEARILNNVAQTQISNGELAAASVTLARGLKISQGGEAAGWHSLLLGMAAQLAFRQGRMTDASRLMAQALSYNSAESDDQAYRELHHTAYLIYKEVGQYQSALMHHEAFTRIDDKGRRLATSTNASLMAASFDFANQNARIAILKTGQLQRDIALTRLQARQSLFLVGSLLAVVLAVVLFLLFYLRSLRHRAIVNRLANERLTAVNLELEDALLAKSQFLATTSHEIRTPLNGVLGMTQILLADPLVAGTVRERVALVHSAGESMRMLVDDILDLAKIDAEGVEVYRVETNVRLLLYEVVSFWRAKADEKGLLLRSDLADCPEMIVEDSRRLRQILSNLLSNAIKFTLDGAVEVRASVDRSEDGREQIVFEVEDSGIGIPANALSKIFEKFRQLDGGTARRFGGTGLGLAISQALARGLGGDLTVSSTVGVGSTFTLRLPLVRAATRIVGQPIVYSRATSLAAARLIVIGGTPIVQGMLRGLLAPQVHSFAAVPDLDTAVRYGAGRDGDIILVEGLADHGDDESDARKVEAWARLLDSASTAGNRLVVLWPEDVAIDPDLLRNVFTIHVVKKPVSGNALIRELKALFATADEQAATAAVPTM